MYLENYSETLQNQIRELIVEDKLSNYLLQKYLIKHSYQNDKALYEYAHTFKNQYLKKIILSKVIYDGRINVINNALNSRSKK